MEYYIYKSLKIAKLFKIKFKENNARFEQFSPYSKI